MGISGIGSGGTMMSFVQLNQNVSYTGQQASKQVTEQTAAMTDVSNFGTETKIGTSPFQQQLKEIAQQGAENIASGMQKVDTVTNNSNYGTSRFQQANEKIMAERQQATAAYTQAANYKQASAGTMVDFAA